MQFFKPELLSSFSPLLFYPMEKQNDEAVIPKFNYFRIVCEMKNNIFKEKLFFFEDSNFDIKNHLIYEFFKARHVMKISGEEDVQKEGSREWQKISLQYFLFVLFNQIENIKDLPIVIFSQ